MRMTKDGLAVAATFLVAEVRKEIAGSKQCEIYAGFTSLCLPLEDVKLNNRTNTFASIVKQNKIKILLCLLSYTK